MNRSGWTPERRERMRVLIHSWAPWRKSTGPRTPEGKARVSRNGWKGGRREELREALRLMRELSRETRRLRELIAL
jgi:hypothetical protein